MIMRGDDRMPGTSLEDLVEFTDNPEPRCACVLLLDTSKSMSLPIVDAQYLEATGNVVDGTQTYVLKKGIREEDIEQLYPLRELNEGIETFKDALDSDPLAALRVETAIVTFGDSVEVVQDFATVDALKTPKLEASGETSTAAAINRALDMLEQRKAMYREAGVSYYLPWVVMMTDGASTDSERQMREASERVHQAEEAKQLAFFSVGVIGADMDELNRIGPRGAVPLEGLAFREFFLWLSSSMTRVSASKVDDEIDLPGISGWAKL